jgi:L-rhamnose mutarotase
MKTKPTAHDEVKKSIRTMSIILYHQVDMHAYRIWIKDKSSKIFGVFSVTVKNFMENIFTSTDKTHKPHRYITTRQLLIDTN